MRKKEKKFYLGRLAIFPVEQFLDSSQTAIITIKDRKLAIHGCAQNIWKLTQIG